MSATRVCLVRHGESIWNAERRVQGHLDVPLNAGGVMEAMAAAKALLPESFDALYASDLIRARDTAELIAVSRHLPVQLSHELRERHFGVFQGAAYDELRGSYPVEYEKVFVKRDGDFAPSGGESLRVFAARVVDCITRLETQHRGGNILIVTHGGVLDVVYRLASGRSLESPRDFSLANAALNWIEIDATSWRVQLWGDDRHLEAVRDQLPL